MKTLELFRRSNVSIVVIMYPNENVKEYAICKDYDSTKEFGNQWSSAKYTINFETAISLFYNAIYKPTYYRLEELATNALHYLNDYGDLEDFEFQYDGLSLDELSYFGLDNND